MAPRGIAQHRNIQKLWPLHIPLLASLIENPYYLLCPPVTILSNTCAKEGKKLKMISCRNRISLQFFISRKEKYAFTPDGKFLLNEGLYPGSTGIKFLHLTGHSTVGLPKDAAIIHPGRPNLIFAGVGVIAKNKCEGRIGKTDRQSSLFVFLQGEKERELSSFPLPGIHLDQGPMGLDNFLAESQT
jgi:hypothetical protein